MSPSLKLRHGLLVAIVGTLLAFQNCAQAPEQSLTGSNSASSYTQKLPLAVRGQIDTLAYMSCSDVTAPLEQRAYFTFRAGAYAKGKGLQLTEEFISATVHYTDTDRGKAFADSAPNGDTLFNLSIRSSANYQSPWVSETFNVGEEIDAFLPALDSAEIAGPLAATSTLQRTSPLSWIQYFPGTSQKRLVEASLRFHRHDEHMKNTRNALEIGGNVGGAFIVTGFSGGADPMNKTLRSPPNSSAVPGAANPVYGQGFQLLFSTGPGVGQGEKHVISNSPNAIREWDLQYSPPMATNAIWDCPDIYKFVIVRPEDKAKNLVVCNATVDRYANTTEQAMLAAIRRVLRVEDWFVDLTNRCVMPKRTGDLCYGGAGTRRVQYGEATCANGTATMCPHYVSVCIRRS